MSNTNNNPESKQIDAWLDEHFSSEERCINYLCRLRWPEGFICPQCGQNKHSRSSPEKLSGYFKCSNSDCKKKTSVISNTWMFHSLRAPIEKIFKFIWAIVQSDSPPHPNDLMRESGLKRATTYKWLHKIDEAISHLLRSKLSGTFYIGTHLDNYRDKKVSWNSAYSLDSRIHPIYFAIALNNKTCKITHSFKSADDACSLVTKDITPQQPRRDFSDLDNYSAILEILKKNIPDPQKHIIVSDAAWEYHEKQAAIRMLYFNRRDLLFENIIKFGLTKKHSEVSTTSLDTLVKNYSPQSPSNTSELLKKYYGFS